MKEPEIARIVKLIYSQGETSRVDLAARTGLVPSYVSSLVRRLERTRWIIEGSRVPSGRGRRKVLLSVSPDLAHVIGVEIGRVHSRVIVTDFLGKVLTFTKFPSELSRGEDLVLKRLHREIRAHLNRDPMIRGIGIAHSGVIDQASGTVLFWPKAPGWREIRLKQLFAEKYGLITTLEDSARTTAIAEQRFGHGKGQRNFVFVHAGVGIGAAIFMDGRLVSGRDGLAGELGHTTVDREGALCSCGNRGCLEVYASGSAVVEKVRGALEHGVASVLATSGEDGYGQLSIEAIAKAAASQDRLCETVLEEVGTHLGTALANIVNLLNPDRIVLGGMLFRVGQSLLMDPLHRALRARAFQRSAHGLELVVSDLGEDAAAVGASLRTAEEILDHLCMRYR